MGFSPANRLTKMMVVELSQKVTQLPRPLEIEQRHIYTM